MIGILRHKLTIITFIFVLVKSTVTSCFSQGVTSFWHFGLNGGVQFENFTPHSISTNTQQFYNSCSSISTPTSDLLYYAEPDSVNNSIDEMLSGSEQLNGYPGYQSVLFIPKPADESVHYLIHQKKVPDNKLYYSIIRRTVDNPLGHINENEKNILLANGVADQITAVHHENGSDIWLVYRSYYNDTVYARLITDQGLSPITIVSNFPPYSSVALANGDGQMKTSPLGNFIAAATVPSQLNTKPKLLLYRFDDQTGVVSDRITFFYDFQTGFKGVEFTEDEKHIYLSRTFDEFEIDRLNIGIYDSSAIIASYDSISVTGYLGSMQIGVDRKIYVAESNSPFLKCIQNPSAASMTAIDFDETAIFLNGAICAEGLPDFITSYFRPAYFDYTNACIDDSVLFMQRYPNPDSVRWNFGDPASADNTSQALEPKHLFSDTGSFTVTLRVYAGNIADTFSRDISLSKPPQTFGFGDSLFICSGDSTTLDIQQNIDFAKYYWSTGSDSHAISIKDTGQVWGVIYNHCDTIYDTTFVAFDDTLNLQPLSDTSFCEGDTLQLLAEVNSRATWLWSNGDSTSQTQITANGNNEIETWVTATNACGSASDTAIITVLPQPNIDWFSDSILCNQALPVITNPNMFGVDYTLLYNNNSAVFDTVNPWNIDTAGIYFLVAENNCDTIVRRAFLSPQQIIEKELLQSIALCPGEEVVLDAFWEGSSYAWSENVDGELVNDSAITVTSAPLSDQSAPLSDQTGALSDQSSVETYTVTITNPPCVRTLSTTVIFLSEDSCGNTCAFSVPNVFTPNQDGVNDAFRILNTCESQTFRFSIYNRWGTLVHSGTEFIAYWDGTSNGAYVNSGVYFLIIEYTDSADQEKTVKAAVSVLR